MEAGAEPTKSAVAAPKAPWSRSTLLAGLVLLVAIIVFLSFAPGTYTVLVTLHVIAAVIWAGGDLTLTTLGIRYERLRDPQTLATLGKVGTWIGTRVYTPASIAAVAFGIAAVAEGNLDWGEFWIIYGLIGWTIAFTVGVSFIGPELGRIDKAAQEFGPESEEVGRRVRRLFAIFRFDTALLVSIVIVMAAKPDF
jgi:uncharacterized membrane protein